MEDNCTSPYISTQYTIVAGLSAASAFISLLASCFIVSLIVLFKKWRSFTQRLVLYLAISVILESIATILHRMDYNNERSAFYTGFCKFSGFVEHCMGWVELMATASITLYVFICAVFKKRTDHLEYAYIFFIFVFPFLFNWIPFTVDAFGRAGAWCWIRNEDIYTCEQLVAGQVLQFVLWYIPLYIILSILIVLYVIMLVKIYCYNPHKLRWNFAHQDDYQQRKVTNLKEVWSLLWYPLIYILINVVPLINRIDGLVDPNNPKLIIWILTAILLPIQGGYIALAYTLLDPDTRKRLKPARFKAAIKEFCQKSRKGSVIKEYPIEHLEGNSVAVYDDADENKTDYVELKQMN